MSGLGVICDAILSHVVYLAPLPPFLPQSELVTMPETVVHFQIRMPPSSHETLASRARNEKRSLNVLIVSLLTQAVERRTELRAKAPEKGEPAHFCEPASEDRR